MAVNEIDTAEDFVAWMKRMNLTAASAAPHLGTYALTTLRYANGSKPLPDRTARQAAIVEVARSRRPFGSTIDRRTLPRI
ncbi:MAG TPA: hypothetical protein VKQ29_13740 [Aliidongia sp.]|nr:hypothetical protein [Aliidongia sp.]